MAVKARVLVSATLLLAAAAAPFAQQAAEPAGAQLPVRRVVLYKSGVGYFEHRGSLTGSVDVAIQFTSAELNDVLKSLTSMDLDNGRISSIGSTFRSAFHLAGSIFSTTPLSSSVRA